MWDPPAAVGTGLKADYRVPRVYADYIRHSHSICEYMLRREMITRITLPMPFKCFNYFETRDSTSANFRSAKEALLLRKEKKIVFQNYF